ncbi:MAG: twin-arginine translocase subunit TatC, partial [Actinomycetota bacterium]
MVTTRTPDGTMTIVEHLGELRRRVIICVVATAVCAVVVFALYEPILQFLSGPYRELTRGDRGCGGTQNEGCDLIVTGPLEPFMVRIRIAGYGGLALAVPIVAWQIWRFVTPALHRNERRYGLFFGLAAVVL